MLRAPYPPGQRDQLPFQAGVAIVNRRRADPSPLFPLLDDPATARVYMGLILLGQDGTEPLLVATLQRFWEDDVLASIIARSFANSGNTTLEDAADVWGSAHGVIFSPYCPVPPCDDSGSWGSIDEVDYDY